MTLENIENNEKQNKFCKNQTRNENRDLCFDLTLNLPDEKTEHFIEAIAPELRKCLGRNINVSQIEPRKRRLGSIIANGMQGQALSRPIHYPRNHLAYRGDTPGWYSAHTFPKLMDHLEQCNYIEGVRASPGIYTSEQSTFLIPEKTISIATESKLSTCDVYVNKQEFRPVIIRDHLGQSVKIDHRNDFIAAREHNVNELNNFLSEFQFSYINENGYLIYPANTSAVRIYNDASTDYGGRYARNFWHSIKKKERENLLIDGVRTLEPDFGCLFPRLAYHSLQIEAPEDCYAIPELMRAAEKQGKCYSTVRPAVKKIMMIGINAEVALNYFKWNFAGLRDVSIEQADEWIWSFNEPIKKYRCSNAGKGFMRIESNILEMVQKEAVRNNIPIAAVHDSCRVKVGSESWVMEEMIKQYHSKMGFLPIVDCKCPK